MKHLTIACICVVLAGCGGGGGGGGGAAGGVVPVVPSTPPTTPTSFNLSGTVNTTGAACDGVAANCAPTGAASSFSVVLGSMPTAGNGGSPIVPLYTATTDSSGHFSLTSVPAGTYEIQIGKDATFATVHAKLILTSAASLAYTVSTLGVGEQTWFTSINSYRASHGSAAIGADEYAMESSRAYAEYLLASPTNCSSNGVPVNCAQFSQQYQSAGGLFSYGDSYRVALSEPNCPAFAEQDSNQGPMLAASSARFGGYGFRASSSGAGACVFAMVTN